MICVSLRGSHYEVGFQHGQCLKNVIHCATRQYCRFFDTANKPDHRAIHDRRALLEAQYPQLIEEMAGISEGAECPLDDVLIMNLGPWLPSCSNIAFYDSDEGPILGHTNDHKPGGHFDTIFAVTLSTGCRMLYVGSAGELGSGAGVSEGGLAVSHANARPSKAKDLDAGLNMNLFSRVLLETCRDAAHAESFLKERTFRSGADNIIVVDAGGMGFVAEKYPDLVEFRRPEEGALCCTNRTLARKIRDAIGQDEYECSAKEISELVSRERYLSRVIDEHQGRFSMDLMKQVLRSGEPEASICNAYTNWAAVLMPNRFEMLVADRFPCHDEFRRYTVQPGETGT